VLGRSPGGHETGAELGWQRVSVRLYHLDDLDVRPLFELVGHRMTHLMDRRQQRHRQLEQPVQRCGERR